MIEFKKYEGAANLTDLGTLAEQIGAKGTVKLSKPNFNSTKRVVIIAENEKGESAVVTCSTNLSNHLRKAKADGASKEELLAYAVGQKVLEGEEGTPFITMPGGEVTEGVTIASLKKVKVTEKVTNLEDVPW